MRRKTEAKIGHTAAKFKKFCTNSGAPYGYIPECSKCSQIRIQGEKCATLNIVIPYSVE